MFKVKNYNLNVTESSGFGFQKCFSRNFQFHRRDPSPSLGLYLWLIDVPHPDFRNLVFQSSGRGLHPQSGNEYPNIQSLDSVYRRGACTNLFQFLDNHPHQNVSILMSRLFVQGDKYLANIPSLKYRLRVQLSA